jgi:hypothetical protein
MSMPEATMDEDDGFVFGKNEIGSKKNLIAC